MALTVAEANAVNTVVQMLADYWPDELGEHQYDALETLSRAAHQRLMAGWSPTRLAEQWPDLSAAAHSAHADKVLPSTPVALDSVRCSLHGTSHTDGCPGCPATDLTARRSA